MADLDAPCTGVFDDLRQRVRSPSGRARRGFSPVALTTLASASAARRRFSASSTACCSARCPSPRPTAIVRVRADAAGRQRCRVLRRATSSTTSAKCAQLRGARRLPSGHRRSDRRRRAGAAHGARDDGGLLRRARGCRRCGTRLRRPATTRRRGPRGRVSDSAWRQHFGADPQVVGRSLRVDGSPFDGRRGHAGRFVHPAERRFLAARAASACRRRRCRSRAILLTSA